MISAPATYNTRFEGLTNVEAFFLNYLPSGLSLLTAEPLLVQLVSILYSESSFTASNKLAR